MKKFLMLLIMVVSLSGYGQGFIGNSATTPDELYSVDPTNSAQGVIVGIGTADPLARLHVVEGTDPTPFSSGFLNTMGITATEVGIISTTQGGTDQNASIVGYVIENNRNNLGVAGVAEGSGAPENVGMFATGLGDASSGAGNNIGIIGYAEGTASGGNQLTNIGVSGETGTFNEHGTFHVGVQGYGWQATTTNWGGLFDADGYATNNYGVRGNVPGTSSAATNYAVYGAATGGNSYYAGYFSGHVHITGTLTGGSDQKLKSNIQDIKNAIDIIKQLEPRKYTFNRENFPSMSLPEGENYGLIAQEVEKVLPNLVSNAVHPEERDKKGNLLHEKVEYKAMNYIGFIPFLIEGMKEQQAVIEKLTRELEALKKSGSVKEINAGGVDPVSSLLKDRALLFQNNPNPFSESTEIKYFLPENVIQAVLNVYDFQGKQIKSMPINQKGNGKISIGGTELNAGMYFYSLIADGKEIDTKRMILTD